MPPKQNGKSLLLLVAVLVVAASLAWFLLSGKPEIRNVLLISLDTTRADHLGCYGFQKSTTPNIDAIAEDGTLFEHAVTPVGLTLPSHSSVFTGTYPPYHQVHDNANTRLSQSSLTLAEVLRAHGFATVAVVSSDVLERKFGLDQGFDVYDDQLGEPGDAEDAIMRSGGDTSLHVREYLAQYRDEPFFMFAHFYDPHIDYAPPEPFASQYADDLYTGEISYMDQCVGEIISKLKEFDLYDSTLIVVMGDHGESLGEHGEAEHGYYVYQSVVHVPLIILSPGERGGKRIGQVVSLVDVMPTILSYLDIPIPQSVQGKDLSGFAGEQSDSGQGRYVYTEAMTATKYGCNPLLGLVGDRWKYIETKRPELYDLKKDPGERNNLIQSYPQMAQHMREELATMTSRLVTAGPVAERAFLDDESIKRLESLGYVGVDNVDVSFEIDQSKAEAKDFVAYHEATQKVFYLLYREEYEQVRQICLKMLKDFPELFNTHHLLGRSSYEQGHWEECIPYFRTYIELATSEEGRASESRVLDPNRPLFVAHKWIAESYYHLEQYEEASQYYSALLAFKFEAPEVHSNLATTLYKLERFDEAVQHWRKSLELKPDNPDTHYKLGGAYHKLGKTNETEMHWREALRLKPDWEEVRNKLPLLERHKRQEAIIAEHLRAVERDPNDAETHDILAGIFYTQKKMSLAIKHWQERLRLRPDDHAAMNNIAWLLATVADANIREPQQAVQLARRAAELTEFLRPSVLDTLAAAYASAGDFENAVQMAEKAIALAEATDQHELAARIQTRLQLYQMHYPVLKRNDDL